jgi:DNA-directed RNA polymerase beta subunit
MEHIQIGTAVQNAEPVTIRIVTVTLREPRVGDKFASRHGRPSPGRQTKIEKKKCPTRGRSQKGTLGQFIEQPDMPYTIDGVVPDLLFDPRVVRPFVGGPGV